MNPLDEMSCDKDCGRVKWSLFWKIISLIVLVGAGMYSSATASIGNVEEKVIEQGKIQSAQTEQIAQIQRDITDIKAEIKESNKTNKSIDEKLDRLLKESRAK